MTLSLIPSIVQSFYYNVSTAYARHGLFRHLPIHYWECTDYKNKKITTNPGDMLKMKWEYRDGIQRRRQDRGGWMHVAMVITFEP